VTDRDQVRAGQQPRGGWSSTSRPSTRGRRFARRLGAFVLLLPLVVGVLGAPASPQAVRGDELSDAKAKQAQLKKDIEAQKAQIDQLNQLQDGLAQDIKNTATVLKGIGVDIAAVKVKITAMQGQIDQIRVDYNALVDKLGTLDAKLAVITAEEVAKRTDLATQQKLLAGRMQNAYDADRTSLLETFLSGATFTDMLAEMSYYIDVGAQDKALADSIAQDQLTLATLHQSTLDTRSETDDLRLQTAAQKRALDASMAALNEQKAELKLLEARTAKALAAQKKAYATVEANKNNLKKALAKAAAAQAKLKNQISSLIQQQMQRGNIPSAYNGLLSWPMNGIVTQPFGCTGFSWEPPYGSCAHFHQGIDIVAPYGTPVHASGDGTVVYIGWNYADGADPAWIVIIAHSDSLQTWYAHMQPRYPGGIHAGSVVKEGQVIGYEGATGHATGAHLHWAVMFNGNFADPRLFL
jgi:murein DD-endopeptidase MepM/ murein hydrolase activator NlpD